MAGNTSRTVTLTLNANTTGSDSVKALAEEMRKLAKSGGDAAPEAEKLAKELDALAKQQNAVENLQSLSAAAEEAKVALSKAETETKAHGQSLQQLKGQLDKATQAEREHAAQVKAAQISRAEAKASYEAARTALAQYTAEIGGAKSANAEEKKVLDEKRNSLRQLKAAYEESKSTVSSLVPEMIRLKDAVAPLAAEYSKQQREMSALTKGSAEAKQATDDFAEAIKQAEAAAKALGVDTSKLTGEQNRLTQSMAALKTQADSVKAAMAGPGTAAMSSAQKIEAAFSGLGVKSVRNLEDEIRKLESAMLKLAQDSTISNTELASAIAAGKARVAELRSEIERSQKAAKAAGSEFGAMFRQFSTASLIFSGVQAGLNAIINAAQGIPKVTAEFQTMHRALTVITGSSQQAAKEFKYITDVANRVGADIKGMGEAYIKLSAATKDTNLAGAETKRIFEAVSGAMGVLGASSADTENAMMAVTQMVSKGVVSMEEMRQQLGERLPGAFQAVAKQLGITTSELNDLISSGQLTANQVLPALSRGLEEMYKTGAPNDTLIGQWNRYVNAVKQSANAVGETGWIEVLLGGLKAVTAGFAHLVEGFFFAGKAAAALASGLRRGGDIGLAMQYISEEAEKMHDRISAIGGGSDKAKKSLSELADEAKKSGKDFVITSEGIRMSVASIDGLNDKLVSQQVESVKAQKKAESYETQMRKLAEATRSAGESAITAANAVGDESEKRRVATQVAADNANALDNLLGAERLHLAILQQRKVMLDEDIVKKGQASDADKKRLEDLQKEIDKQQAAVDGTEKQVDANNALRDALEAEALALKDNSGQLETLRTGYEDFQRVLAIVRAEVDAGRLSRQQGMAAEEVARKQKFLYLDALKDEQEKLAALEKQKAAQFSLETQGLQLAITKQRSLMQTAKLMGDEYGVQQAGLEIKRLEIQLAEIQIKVKTAEAQATLAIVAAQREDLQARGLLTAAKQAELRAQELGAQAKLKEAEITKESTKQMKELYDITRLYSGAAESAAGGLDSIANSADRASRSVSRLNSEMREQSSSESMLNTGGSPSRQVDLTNELYKQGATVEEVKAAQKFTGELAARNLMALEGTLRGGAYSNSSNQLNDALKRAAREALELARIEQAGGEVDLGASVMDYRQRNLARTNWAQEGLTALGGQTAAQQAGQRAAAQTSVKITIGDKTQTIKTASVADNAALVGVFKLLESDMLKAS